MSYTRNTASLPPPPEVITYRLGDKLVLVKPPMDYDEAIDLAIQEFPALKSITDKGDSRERISFYTVTTMHGSRHSVCISKSAWKPCVSRMLRGDVVNIVVVNPNSNSDPAVYGSLTEPPPGYLEIPESTSSHRKSRSTPPSKGSSSRHPSPSGSTRSSGSSTRRSWFKRS